MKELKLLNLYNLYTLRVCVEMHPHIYPTEPKNRPQHDHEYIWTAQIHDYPTRHSLQQHQYIPNSHTTKEPAHITEYLTRQYSAVWNTLPLAIRQEQCLPKFKLDLQAHLQTEQDR
jgi:hypothetical protein